MLPRNDTHPSEDILRAYASDSFTGAIAADIQQHLEQCERCRAIVAGVPVSNVETESRSYGTESTPHFDPTLKGAEAGSSSHSGSDISLPNLGDGYRI
ncbi:MAG: hypothetical protein ACRCZF_06860, partial [Gemmataceae bacterium]